MTFRSPLVTRYTPAYRYAALVGTIGMALTLFPPPPISSRRVFRLPLVTRHAYRQTALFGSVGMALTLSSTIPKKPISQSDWPNPKGPRW